MTYLFTSESVSEGHPDKLCDRISDEILDACLSVDKGARVAVETMVKGTDQESHIIIGGEITLEKGKTVDYEAIARKTALDIGYSDHSVGMNAGDSEQCKVIVLISEQSRDISQGVDEDSGLHLEQGAGDQGLMFGFATNESENFDSLRGAYMPLPAALSQRLTLQMTKLTKDGALSWARPDSKSQVTLRYDTGGIPSAVDTVVIAIQHDDLAKEKFDGDIEREREFIRDEIKNKVINRVIPEEILTDETKIIINGTGRFILGGPHADAGLTGRKIIVDTYGGMGRHGGGAFSGKDPSKVDRSAAYAARWAAKHVVASGVSDACEIQLAYAIGVAEPVSIRVSTKTPDGGLLHDARVSEMVKNCFDFRPQAIISNLKLKNPIYSKTAAGGHFGRMADSDGSFSWEVLDEEKINFLKNN